MANTKKNDEVTYEIKKKIGTVGKKQINLVSWNGADPKYDIREWWTGKDGTLKCGKGLTFTAEEIAELKEIVNNL